MAEHITALVFRFDPDRDPEPRYQEYVVPVEEDVSVLALLNRIQQEIDPTLGFRSFCCGLQMCGSCLMRVDGKRRFACITVVKPGQKITIDPLAFPAGHIRDLVVQTTEEEQEDNEHH